ncbi:MAG: acetyl/propionyl/methylcrotonyl-CoA carboxylase subunit alpha [Geodermatophilaceae bacterium]|nr:acetyl/propionyl/methylcrotonyl-CoA carboxylase subunit alpha [Geodermatophilaceae bacterium]
MFQTVLIANRGEIAVRVIRTLRAMGIRSVAVYSDADRDARHVREADAAVRVGPAAAADSYLSIERIVEAAISSRAQAIHPGYGFLAENADFVGACTDAGLVFIGPPASAIEAMGDKIRAKQTVEAAGVPVVPGRHRPGLTDADLVAAAGEIGYPVLLKPSAGGGGKGMRQVAEPAALAEAIAGARREARGAFGDDTLLIERLVQTPRHIEIQLLADQHGTVLHLGERECSLQRRHQKIIEEAPSVLLDSATRSQMGAAAVEAARAVGYTGAGTVEFIVSADRPGEFFFMEMNTRLQVEHPVTELVTGLDLVEQQIRVAAGEPLTFGQDDIELSGHAVEARIYAEDPANGFLPTGGTVRVLREPDLPHVRVDSGLREGVTIGSDYDPMLAKVIAWAPDRSTALSRLDAALAETVVLGVRTNIAFLRALCSEPDVVAGRLDTGLVARRVDALVDDDVPEDVLAAAALERLIDLEPVSAVVDPFDIPGGWRVGEASWASWLMQVQGHEAVDVRVRGRASSAEVAVGETPPFPASVERIGEMLRTSYAGRTHSYAYAEDGDVVWLGRDGRTWAVREQERLAAARHDSPATGGPILSPMPGIVTMVRVAVGDAVTAGQSLVVVEAMKMEHAVLAPSDGAVAELFVHSGQRVALGAPVATISAQEK